MPTVLALDVSLSMCRPVKGETNTEDYSRKNLAIHGLTSLLDQFSKLEFTSLVVDALNRHIGNINFPQDQAALAETKRKFFRYANIPNCIGAVDGTLIEILAPRQNEAVYVCRKGYHSINIQAVVDADMRFTDVVAKWPGSTHDSTIFNNSGIQRWLEHSNNGWLVGDSGYALRPYLLTPKIVFSYLWEQLVPFTRDTDAIKSALNTVGDYSKTCLEPFLSGIGGLIVEEFGGTTPVQVILVTDGSTGVGTGSLKNIIDTWNQSNEGDNSAKCPLPFSFKGKLIIVCIANPSSPELKKAMPLYERLIELNGDGELFIPDGQLGMASVQDMFTRIAEKYYTPFTGLLTCGHLKCNITLYPSPETYRNETEFTSIERSVSDRLEICGFMDLQDIASPPTVSRHLVLPIPNKQKPNNADNTSEKGKEEEEVEEDGKQPSFTVLLHGSLKVEGMVAVTKVAEDWYGILYSWADSKKKSSLMLSLFEPGVEAVSWLGSLNYLAPIADFSEPPYGDDDNRSPFPVRPKEKRSYAQSCVVWIKSVGLQADLQKVIRHARKLPDKQQQFYKELNRVRKAALSFGFTDLLEAIAKMLERECTMLPGTAHPDAALQLTHAASKLCSDMAKDGFQLIVPLRTNFSQDDG